jgi:hypothetical protein
MKNIERCMRNGAKCKWPWKDYLPKDNWSKVARVESEPKLSGILLRWFGLDRFIPREIYERLDRPNQGGIFYLTWRYKHGDHDYLRVKPVGAVGG